MSKLKSYYRKPKAFIDIPSKGALYALNEDQSIMNEIGVMPMTMMNHLTANNPESLINGHVLEEFVRDCTTITNIEPRKMFKCDIDALIMGIRMVSVDDTLDLSLSCPSCKKENDYAINLRGMLSEMTTHEELPYKLKLDDLVLNVIPSTLESAINTEQAFFQDAKAIDEVRKIMDKMKDNVDDKGNIDEGVTDEIMGYVKDIYDIQRQMAETTIKLYADSVYSVTIPGDEEVTDREEIFDFVSNLSDKDHTLLKNKVRDINMIGVPKEHNFTCSHCKHEFTAPVELNPTDFFGNGSQ